MNLLNIYLMGSLRNPRIPEVAATLRKEGWFVFDDWYAAGPEADDCWQRYEQARGHDFRTALGGYSARHVFEYDLYHLNACDLGVLVLPAGKSGHLELGYLLGQGKPAFILLDQEPERFDVMYGFATAVCANLPSLVDSLAKRIIR